MHADFIIYTHRHTYLKQGSSFTDLPATRGPDCAKLYIGPGKKSDEDECDGCADGGGASPITKAETKVKNKLYKKKIICKLATKQFSCTIHIILDTDIKLQIILQSIKNHGD